MIVVSEGVRRKRETWKSQKQGDYVKFLTLTDRNSEDPLWAQVKCSLTELIRTERLTEHDRLPSESELCRIFGVSRTVVREALAQMVNEGLIYRLQGSGAFVQGRRAEQDFVGSTVGFSGELVSKDKSVKRKVLRQEVIFPSPRVCRKLKIDGKTPIVAIDRLLLVNDAPTIIVRWRMPQRLVPGLEDVSLVNRSLYDTIAERYGIQLVRADRWIEAISLGSTDAKLLKVENGKSALYVESVASGEDMIPIEYYSAPLLTDTTRLHFSVSAG